MSAGFYKYSPMEDAMLYGKRVYDAHYELSVENKDGHTYPVDGWYWFDSREQALAHFGIVDPEPQSEVT